jgi:hypothetical protein
VNDLVDDNGWDFWGKEPDADDPYGDGQTAVDKRYHELSARLVDSTRLDELPKPEPLIENTLSMDSLAWLAGKPGHGKSFVALDLACHVATGTKWRGLDVQQGKVLYIVGEGAQGLEQRKDAWEAGNVIEVPADALTFLPVAVQVMHNPDIGALRRIVAELEPVLIVIDTQARSTVGAEENSSKDMGHLVSALDAIRLECGACILVVHHEARAGENMRGSTALEGAATTILRAVKEGRIVTLKCAKQKDGAEFDPIIGLLEKAWNGSVYYSHEAVVVSDLMTEAETKLLGSLRESFGSDGASASQLLKVSGLPEQTFYRARKALVNKGIIANIGSASRTRYVLTEGQERL